MALKPKFGLTGPVGKLAKKYKIPYEIAAGFVDHAWADAGFRTKEQVYSHVKHVDAWSFDGPFTFERKKYERFLKDCDRIVQDCIRAAQ